MPKNDTGNGEIEMGYIKRPKQKTNRELLAEDIAEARKLGP